jgi:hypothetical protein
MWNPEDLLKGRMAEALVEELLKRSGNKVYRFGYESVLQNLTQVERAFDRQTEVGQQIRSIPDFLVLNRTGKPFFVEVKFRLDPEWKFDDRITVLKNIERFWKAKVIMVTLQQPYFRVASPPYFDENGKLRFEDLENDDDLDVTIGQLEDAERLIEDYFSSLIPSRFGRKISKIAARI